MFARIQKERIDVQALIEATRNPESGALVTFQGTVRRFSGDTEVLSLHYEAYESMAMKQIEGIMKEAIDKFGLMEINVIHRIGDMELTEDTVAICVSSPHRDDAFKACRFVIDEIKTKVPIWKQDIPVGGDRKWH